MIIIKYINIIGIILLLLLIFRIKYIILAWIFIKVFSD